MRACSNIAYNHFRKTLHPEFGPSFRLLEILLVHIGDHFNVDNKSQVYRYSEYQKYADIVFSNIDDINFKLLAMHMDCDSFSALRDLGRQFDMFRHFKSRHMNDNYISSDDFKQVRTPNVDFKLIRWH